MDAAQGICWEVCFRSVGKDCVFSERFVVVASVHISSELRAGSAVTLDALSLQAFKLSWPLS
jgi:hypothetical protein